MTDLSTVWLKWLFSSLFYQLKNKYFFQRNFTKQDIVENFVMGEVGTILEDLSCAVEFFVLKKAAICLNH